MGNNENNINLQNTKLILCLLCRRKFDSEENLRKHE
jgi:hypothetical protein